MKKKRMVSCWLGVFLISFCFNSVIAVAEEASAPNSVEAVTEEASAPDSTEAVTEEASAANSAIASANEMVETEAVVEEGMVPVTPDQLVPGVYEAEIRSSSSMFKVESCELTVAENEMSAVLTMSSSSYRYLFPGTPEEAVSASEEAYIPLEEDESGRHTFTIPVEALDKGFDCAAFSNKKEKWYPRTLAVMSSSLPADAFAERDLVTAEDLGLEDGSYLIDAVLSGGSGRASIESPASLTIEDGQMTLKVVFGSPNYDYMLVNGERYEPVNTEGNSTFLIPADGLDYFMPVTADTVAMSTPHEIDYQIFLDSASIKAEE